jgi:MFS family permease
MGGGFLDLLRQNRNFRLSWFGQIVSEIGDHFNTISVFSLALQNTRSGLVVSGIMLARAVPMILAGPVAGVLLDRWDRKKIMLASDVFRALVAALFLFSIAPGRTWLLYVLSGLLMFASPFFTSGRTAILPTIASPEELHTANSITQTTRYMGVTLGTLLGGMSAAGLGFQAAFLINIGSFLFSALMISQMRLEQGHFRPVRKALTEADVMRPWQEYREGLRYMTATPLIFGIALTHVGWATGGGAAQILFSLFGEIVFDRGPAGIGMIWSSAGVGLLVGAAIAHGIGERVSFEGYKKIVVVSVSHPRADLHVV